MSRFPVVVLFPVKYSIIEVVRRPGGDIPQGLVLGEISPTEHHFLISSRTLALRELTTLEDIFADVEYMSIINKLIIIIP